MARSRTGWLVWSLRNSGRYWLGAGDMALPRRAAEYAPVGPTKSLRASLAAASGGTIEVARIAVGISHCNLSYIFTSSARSRGNRVAVSTLEAIEADWSD